MKGGKGDYTIGMNGTRTRSAVRPAAGLDRQRGGQPRPIVVMAILVLVLGAWCYFTTSLSSAFFFSSWDEQLSFLTTSAITSSWIVPTGTCSGEVLYYGGTTASQSPLTSSNNNNNKKNNNNKNNEGSASQRLVIPYRLSFNYYENLLINIASITGPTKELACNVNRTIHMFQQTWKNMSSSHDNDDSRRRPIPRIETVFLSNVDCEKLVQQIEPKLLQPFLNESGSHKSDICRVCDLYQYGGYYLDNDLAIIHVPLLPHHISFATVMEINENNQKNNIYEYNNDTRFFQAFLAASPYHPILKEAIHVMVQYYQGELNDNNTIGYMGNFNIGTWTMKVAYDRIVQSNPSCNNHIWLLNEINLQDQPTLFPQIVRDSHWRHYNNAVMNRITNELYFWSRLGITFRQQEQFMGGPIGNCITSSLS